MAKVILTIEDDGEELKVTLTSNPAFYLNDMKNATSAQLYGMKLLQQLTEWCQEDD